MRPSSLLLGVLLSLLLLSGLPSGQAMFDTDVSLSCSSDDSFFAAWNFQFDAGGSYTLVALTLLPSESWQVRNHSVQILIATETQLEPIRQASMEQVCRRVPFDYAPVTAAFRLGGGGETTIRYSIPSIPERDWYRLLVLNCDQDDFTMRYSSVAVNPGGEYLSLSQVPYKGLFHAYAWIWAAGAAAWIVHIFLYRHFNVAIQCALLLLPVIKGALCVPSLLYWRSASHNGVYPQGLGWAVLLTSTAERVIWFLVAYLLASGWRVTKHSLHPLEQRGLSIILCLMTLSYFLYHYYGGFLIFLLLFSTVLALRIVFSAIVENGNMLLRQMAVLHRADIEVRKTPLQDKINIFKALQISVLVYVSVNVIFQLWAAIFLKSLPWVGDAAEHTLSFLVCAALAWSYRMRPFNPFFLSIISALIARAPEEAAPAGRAGAEGGGRAPAGASRAEGQPRIPPSRRGLNGDGYQTLAEDASSSHSSVALDSVVVQRNDPSSDDAFASPGMAHAASRARPSGVAGLCQREVGDDQLWRPFCPVPPLSECVPDVEGWGGGEVVRDLAAARRMHEEAARHQALPPVLILENPSGDGDRPPMIGTLLRADDLELAAGAPDEQRWGDLPAAALPYLPARVRSELAAQDRMRQQDPRGAGVPAHHDRHVHVPASGVARPSHSRRPDFPAYI